MQLLTIAVRLKQLCICDCDAEFLKKESSNGLSGNEASDLSWLGSVLSVPFSDVMPLVECQEGHPACKLPVLFCNKYSGKPS